MFARFSTDAAADILAQADTTRCDVIFVAADQDGLAALRAGARASLVTVVAPLPAGRDTVLVRATGDDGEAALRIGADVAAAYRAELVVDAGTRPARRFATAVRGLGGTLLGAAAPPTALVVGTAAAADAHLVVRAGREAVRAGREAVRAGREAVRPERDATGPTPAPA